MKESNCRSYYLYIALLIILILIPPLLRVIIPKDENSIDSNKLNSKVKKEVNLYCEITKAYNNDVMSINVNTNYIDSKIDNIVFNYVNFNESNFSYFKEYYNELNNLKSINGVEMYGNLTLFFNFNKNNLSNQKSLEKYTNKVDSQKKYYESKGYSCYKYEM